METLVIQLQALRKPVVTVHFNELNQLRKCCLYCGVAVCLVKHLPAYTEDFFFFFLNGLSSVLLMSVGPLLFFFPLTLQVENEL